MKRFLAALAPVAIAVTLSAGPYSAVSLGLSPDEYFGTTYAAPPIEGHAFMFYMGEPLCANVDFFDSGDAPERLQLDGHNLLDLVDVGATLDGNAVPVQWQANSVDLKDREGRRATLDVPGAELTLQPGARLTIHGELTLPAATPGVYIVEVSTSLLDSGQRPVAPQSTRLDFELRRPLSGDAAELSRRRALASLSASQFDQAERALGQLIAANPNSFAAFLIRGQLAEVRGQQAGALAQYRRALEILERDQDRQLFSRIGSLERESQQEGLRVLILRLGGR